MKDADKAEAIVRKSLDDQIGLDYCNYHMKFGGECIEVMGSKMKDGSEWEETGKELVEQLSKEGFAFELHTVTISGCILWIEEED